MTAAEYARTHAKENPADYSDCGLLADVIDGAPARRPRAACGARARGAPLPTHRVLRLRAGR